MKNWKTVVMTLVVILLVAISFVFVWDRWETRAIRSRIRKYGFVKQEQQAIYDILKLRYDSAVIQAQFKPAPPVVEPPKEEKE